MDVSRPIKDEVFNAYYGIFFNIYCLYFKYIFNIPIEVAGESCKKTIVNASVWKTNGMILYAISSKFMASSKARGHEI